MCRDHPYLIFIRIAAILLMTGGLSHAFAQKDPPGRVARINYSEGNVAYAPASEKEWTDADLNRPLVAGDKLWTDKNVRAEIQIGSAVVRMDGRTRLTVLALDDQSAQLSVTQGTVYMRVRNLPEGENFEIDTPNLAYRAAYPGDYRIDVDSQQGVTRVTIASGTGAVYGEKGQALPLGGGEQISFKGRALEKVNVQESPPQDNFDRWAAERNRRDDQSVAARYVPRDAVGYQLLDAAGEWRNDANFGAVWFPQGTAAKWAPFRNGRWEWIGPWGWTWIDDAPWGFVTSHYGRWAQIGTRWAWAPGRMGLRPVYAPALVAFVGNGNSPLSVGGKQTVAWIPLAPGEAWQPTYPATQLYISSVNANMPPLKQGSYAYQRKPDALTAISLDDFHRGKPSKGSWLQVAANSLGNAQVAEPPPMPDYAKATAVAARAPVQAPVPQRTQPTVPEIQQVANSGPTVQQQIDAQKRAQQESQAQAQALMQAQREQERAQRDKQARAEQAQAERAKAEQDRQQQQQRLAEQRRIAEQLRVAEQARRAEQQKAALEQQRIAEQTRRAEQQKELEQQRLAQQKLESARIAQQRIAAQQQQARAAEAARATQARRDAVTARRVEQAKREQVAKREREAKAERELQAKRAQAQAQALAKKDEQARRAAHAQQLEQARRAADHDAQVLAQQRAEREAQQRKVAEEKERAQRDAWQKQQQALAEQFKRDQQAWDAQQRAKAQRGRPDLHKSTPAPGEPEVWQRGIPILAPGRTS